MNKEWRIKRMNDSEENTTNVNSMVVIIAFFLLLISFPAWAGTINASSCSQSAVQAAVNSASSGDTVFVPAGNCTWSSQVNITKGITVQGASQDSTVINANNSALFNIKVASGIVRLTGIGFTGTGGGTDSSEGSTLIQISGQGGVGIFDYARIDHCKFTNVGSFWCVLVAPYWDMYSDPKVLFDHITFATNNNNAFAKLFANNNSWKEPDNYGTDNAIFIEDSTFSWPDGKTQCIMDTENGVRMVVRHNDPITNGAICQHDTGSTAASRGNRLQEIYSNNFICNAGSNCSEWPGVDLRGGTAVVYNNTISSRFFAQGWPIIYRAVYTNSWLGGACSGSSGKMCDTDSLMHCSNSPSNTCWYAADTGPCGGARCVVACSTDSDCPSGVHCVSIDGPSGYPCRDQTGFGQEDSNGMNTSSPVYWWSNVNENGSPVYISSGYSQFVQNRDFYYSAKPGYTAYTYPHPLQVGASLQAPQNLRIQGP